MEKVVQLKTPCENFLDVAAIRKALGMMAIRRSVDPGVLALEVYSADLANLDATRYTTGDVIGAVQEMGLEERAEGESSWPEVGKIINRVKQYRAKRCTEEERSLQARSLPAPEQDTSMDEELRARVDALNRKFGLSKKMTA